MKKIEESPLNGAVVLLTCYSKMSVKQQVRLIRFAKYMLNPEIVQPPLPGLVSTALERFWTFFDAHAETLNHSRNVHLIAINRPEILQKMWNASIAINTTELSRYLPFSSRPCLGVKNVNSRLLNRTIKCWIFCAAPIAPKTDSSLNLKD